MEGYCRYRRFTCYGVVNWLLMLLSISVQGREGNVHLMEVVYNVHNILLEFLFSSPTGFHALISNDLIKLNYLTDLNHTFLKMFGAIILTRNVSMDGQVGYETRQETIVSSCTYLICPEITDYLHTYSGFNSMILDIYH